MVNQVAIAGRLSIEEPGGCSLCHEYFRISAFRSHHWCNFTVNSIDNG